MIRIDKQIVLAEVPDATIWSDDTEENLYYVLPKTPRVRLNAKGKPVFKFIKYRLPKDRADGKKGGGFVFFDTEIVVDAADMNKITELLQAKLDQKHQAEHRAGPPPKVVFGTFTYTRGTVKMMLEENGVLIEKVRSAGKPSLYGSNNAAFMVELTPEGATIFEAAMQGEGASAISVVYDLYFWVKLPPMKAIVDFNSRKFYDYCKTVSVEVSGWSEDHYREDMREVLTQSQSATAQVFFDFALPDPVATQKLKEKLQDWAQRTLEDTLTRAAAEAAAPANPNILNTQKLFDKTLEDLGSDDLDNFQQTIHQEKIMDFHYEYRENSAAEWNLAPQGNLPALTTLKDVEGKPILWKDYSLLIDADDPFFKRLNVVAQVNADFANLPIFNVVLNVYYPTDTGEIATHTASFTKGGETVLIDPFMVNKSHEYTYDYTVNFKGDARPYKSKPKIPSSDKVLTINVDDMGIFTLDTVTGDIDYDQIALVEVKLTYPLEGPALVQEQFTLTKASPTHRVLKVIHEAVTGPFRYGLKYVLKDHGKEIQTAPQLDGGNHVIVNDPWKDYRKVTVRSSGNLKEKINNIVVNLTYVDEPNNYRREESITLDAVNPAGEWSFPTMDSTQGVLKYTASIHYRAKPGESEIVEEVQEETAKQNTILVGPKVLDVLEVTVMPDLMFDNKDVRLVRVALSYKDDDHQINVRAEHTFKPGMVEPFVWKVDLRDAKKTEYSWETIFFVAGKQGGPTTQRKVKGHGKDLTLLPELPAQPA
jgi:hypothetical protein